METAKENGLNPMACLIYLFERMPPLRKFERKSESDMHRSTARNGRLFHDHDATRKVWWN
ncbi:transposase IS66 [Alicyclobacillus hesperidum URH17-3-68]|nr:transposase IS66 [Alicyclobacillus hesperidum URH17-3-68]